MTKLKTTKPKTNGPKQFAENVAIQNGHVRFDVVGTSKATQEVRR